MTRFCPSCGVQLTEENIRFCPKCGAPQTKAQPQQNIALEKGAVSSEGALSDRQVQIMEQPQTNSAMVQTPVDSQVGYQQPAYGYSSQPAARSGIEDMKTVSCAPEDEIDCVRLWESFGYYMFSSNEVYNKDTSTTHEVWGDTIFEKTHVDVTHYVKMVFRRNPNRPNYERLRALEAEYENYPSPGDPPRGWDIVLIFIGLCFFFIPGILMIISNIKKMGPETEEYKRKLAEYNAARAKIVEQAQALL